MFSPLSTLSQLSPGEPQAVAAAAQCSPLWLAVSKGPQARNCAGYFDAPGAAAAPLKLFQAVPTALPDVTLVFCCIESLKDMKV